MATAEQPQLTSEPPKDAAHASEAPKPTSQVQEPAPVLPKDAPEAPAAATEPRKAAAPLLEPAPFNLFKADFLLRLLLFAATVTSVVLVVTGNETRSFSSPFSSFQLAFDAKFVYSPALIYFVAAISTACLHSILSAGVSLYGISRPTVANKFLFPIVMLDALMLGVVSSATGAAGAIAYVGLRGNSHVGWTKVCDIYSKFCTYVGSSVIVSLAASIVLVLLVIVSAYSLHHRTR